MTRNLNQVELNQIQKAIAVKDLTSAEILMEIYDHYVSHLESKSVEEFRKELFELEQKFTYSYCHAIQAKLLKSSKKELKQIQWSVWKSYLTWPRFLGTISLFIILTGFWDNLVGKARGLAVVIPMLITILVYLYILIKSKKKVSNIKRALGKTSKIQSSYITSITHQLLMVVGIFNLFIHLPKVFFFEEAGFLESYYFMIISFFLCLFYLGYALSLVETWKIKSKTALV